jgi:hypothetical protein
MSPVAPRSSPACRPSRQDRDPELDVTWQAGCRAGHACSEGLRGGASPGSCTPDAADDAEKLACATRGPQSGQLGLGLGLGLGFECAQCVRHSSDGLGRLREVEELHMVSASASQRVQAASGRSRSRPTTTTTACCRTQVKTYNKHSIAQCATGTVITLREDPQAKRLPGKLLDSNAPNVVM